MTAGTQEEEAGDEVEEDGSVPSELRHVICSLYYTYSCQGIILTLYLSYNSTFLEYDVSPWQNFAACSRIFTYCRILCNP